MIFFAFDRCVTDRALPGGGLGQWGLLLPMPIDNLPNQDLGNGFKLLDRNGQVFDISGQSIGFGLSSRFGSSRRWHERDHRVSQGPYQGGRPRAAAAGPGRWRPGQGAGRS